MQDLAAVPLADRLPHSLHGQRVRPRDKLALPTSHLHGTRNPLVQTVRLVNRDAERRLPGRLPYRIVHLQHGETITV